MTSNAGDRAPEIRFDLKHFPMSPMFAQMLYHLKFVGSAEHFWGDQVSEGLLIPDSQKAEERRQAVIKELNDPLFHSLITKTYNVFGDLLTGVKGELGSVCENRRFFFVVAGPRQGGSYLTKELYRAVGVAPEKVPEVLAHDGHPTGGPFWFTTHNGMTLPFTKSVMLQLAEWLVLSDYQFKDLKPVDGLKTIIKKSTRMLHYPELVRELPVPDMEWVSVVRHPVSACVSVYEKSGGLPDNGLFPAVPRSMIEAWVSESWARDGFSREQVSRQPYFRAYLHYWQRYHQTLVAGGLLRGNGKASVLGYHPAKMEGFIRRQIARFGVADNSEPETFFANQKARARHPDWVTQADPVIQGVHELWQTFGLGLPSEIRDVF